MPKRRRTLRVALAAWENGRTGSGLGVKIGGLGAIVEELPPALVKAGAKQGLDLEIETLTPCFAHYDKRQMTRLDLRLPATIAGHTFEFDVYEHIFPDGQKVVYFWDQGQLHWTTASAVYPSDPQVGLILHAAVSQAMAGYIKQGRFDTVHLHDYHVGLIPFYLGDEYLQRVPVHFTIHNASYQGIVPLSPDGYRSLERINLSGDTLFHKYFDFFNNLNLMKACLLKVHETGGKVTTVSGDIAGTWGYAAELQESHAAVWARAYHQKGAPPGEVFVPNRHLDVFEKLPVAGITNGLSDRNRPEQLPELRGVVLRAMQDERGPERPIFTHPVTQREMLTRDHTFDVHRLEVKEELKRLLHLEAFALEPLWDPILMTAVGRLVDQKNLGLVADIVERTLLYDDGVKFIILAAAPEGDAGGKASEARFVRLAAAHPRRVYFNNCFDAPLSRLILAGGDFTLIPSRFEPCGLVDYEASLLGNIVIGRATGGLTKVRHCAYLYEWLDISDRAGEADAFLWQIRAAIATYRHDRDRHAELIRTAMTIDASWDASAAHYVEMLRYGLLAKQWQAQRRQVIESFTRSLDRDKAVFAEFFDPGRLEYGDRFDWELKRFLSQPTPEAEARVVREKTARTTRKKAEVKAPAPGPARRPRPPT
jgi:glycogen synthase